MWLRGELTRALQLDIAERTESVSAADMARKKESRASIVHNSQPIAKRLL